MTNLLTQYMEFLIRIVIGGGVEVSVIHLGRALGNVRTTGDINGGQAEPPIVAVSAVAYLYSSGDHFTVSTCSASNSSEIHHRGTCPIRDRGIERSDPIRRKVITD